jgi:hypothetical protein
VIRQREEILVFQRQGKSLPVERIALLALQLALLVKLALGRREVRDQFLQSNDVLDRLVVMNRHIGMRALDQVQRLW